LTKKVKKKKRKEKNSVFEWGNAFHLLEQALIRCFTSTCPPPLKGKRKEERKERGGGWVLTFPPVAARQVSCRFPSWDKAWGFHFSVTLLTSARTSRERRRGGGEKKKKKRIPNSTSSLNVNKGGEALGKALSH